MSKTLNETPITTANARSKLGPGEYARRLDADAAVWYRKGARGGVWFARWRNRGAGAAYKQAPIGPANDINDKPTEGLFTYLQAEKSAREIVSIARMEAKAKADGPVLTVRLVVETYIAERDNRETRRQGRDVNSDASQRLHRYLLGQDSGVRRNAVPADPLAAVTLPALKEKDLESWRKRLPETLKATTKKRLINDLKAALNAGYAANRSRLDPQLLTVIKHGLKAEVVDDDDAVAIARDGQILTDTQVGRLIRAAQEIDAEQNWDGDLARLVIVLAATGARLSQVTRLRVRDYVRAKSRLMVPASRKGKGKSGSIPVPVGSDVLDALLPAVTGRAGDEWLLERWRYQQPAGGIRWEKVDRIPWPGSSAVTVPWKAIRERAAMPEVIPYALRHSSIVRGLRANLPIRLVAALHDTSVVMIERHYAREAAEGLEELAARAVVPLVPAESNIIQMHRAT
ncbi:MAG: integrase [Mesorhizobium sp.]|nr:integrase [Mesorhizobium sp.]MBL8579538.1 integrase [Mesorhizobium sp.]